MNVIYIQNAVDWSVNMGGGMEVSNPLDLLEVFLRNPRIAPNLGMYTKLLQVEGCDQRKHFGDELLETYPRTLQIEGCDQREHFEDEHIENEYIETKQFEQKCMD